MGAAATCPPAPRPTIWDRRGVQHGPGAWARVGSPRCPFQYWRALLARSDGPAGAQLAGVLWLALPQADRDEVAAEFEEWRRWAASAPGELARGYKQARAVLMTTTGTLTRAPAGEAPETSAGARIEARAADITPADAIPDDALALVLAFAGEVAPAARAVCRRWRLVRVAWPRPATLADLARAGHEALLAWVAATQGRPLTPRQLNQVLAGAAEGGRLDLAGDARRQGARDYDGMLAAAARGGREGAALLAKTWGAADFDRMLLAATEAGQRRLAVLAKTWGARNYDRMLVAAARRGDAALAALADDWGATSHSLMLAAAGFGGHENIVRLAQSWGLTAFDGALAEAARGGHEALARLARELGARNVDSMLIAAARGGQPRLAALAREWGATAFRPMGAWARLSGQPELAALAQRWDDEAPRGAGSPKMARGPGRGAERG